MRSYGLVILALLVIAGFGAAQALRRPEIRLRADAALLRLPLIGRLIRDLHAARHPYTQGLLNSLPRLDAPVERLAVLERRPEWKDGPLDPALVDASMIDAFPGGVR